MTHRISPAVLAWPIFAVCLVLSQSAAATLINWVDWTSADSISATGTANGVTVDFTGNINPAAQTSGGTNYWANNSSTYTSVPEVDNAPPDSDIIRLTGGSNTGTQTITFSIPVVDPVMAILSMGQFSIPVRYDFDTGVSFDILNVGPGHFDGAGNGSLTELAGDVLEGREGHGLIQFNGTYSSISWTIPAAEFWHGFQVGIADADGPDPIPEPATLALMSLGLAGLGFIRRRTKQ